MKLRQNRKKENRRSTEWPIHSAFFVTNKGTHHQNKLWPRFSIFTQSPWAAFSPITWPYKSWSIQHVRVDRALFVSALTGRPTLHSFHLIVGRAQNNSSGRRKWNRRNSIYDSELGSFVARGQPKDAIVVLCLLAQRFTFSHSPFTIVYYSLLSVLAIVLPI